MLISLCDVYPNQYPVLQRISSNHSDTLDETTMLHKICRRYKSIKGHMTVVTIGCKIQISHNSKYSITILISYSNYRMYKTISIVSMQDSLGLLGFRSLGSLEGFPLRCHPCIRALQVGKHNPDDRCILYVYT